MSPRSTFERVYALFDALRPDEYGCINFLGVKGTGPVGWAYKISVNGKHVKASRVALERTLGRPIAPGLLACHICDNPSCINSAHLYEGSPHDNVQDMVERNPDWMESLRVNAARASSMNKQRYETDPDFRAELLIKAARGRAMIAQKYATDPEFRVKRLANLKWAKAK